MLKDKLILAILAGMVGVLVRDLYSLLFKVMGITKHFIWTLSAGIFLEEKYVHTAAGWFLGAIVDLTIGSMLGVSIALLIKWVNTKHKLLLGWGVGLAAWLFFFGVLQHTLPHTEPLAPVEPASNISSFVEHSLFGLVTAWTYMALKERYFTVRYKRK